MQVDALLSPLYFSAKLLYMRLWGRDLGVAIVVDEWPSISILHLR